MKILNAHIRLIFASLTVLLLTGITIYSQGQEVEYRRTSIRAGTGIGINAGQKETGIGFVYSAGMQKSYDENRRLRLNPNILLGSFRIDARKSRLAYEIRPFNLYFGNKGYILWFFMFGIDFKFKE